MKYRLTIFIVLCVLSMGALRTWSRFAHSHSGISHIRNVWKLDDEGTPEIVGFFRYMNNTEHDVTIYRCTCGASCGFEANFPLVVTASRARCFPIRFSAIDVVRSRMRLTFLTDAEEPVEIDWFFRPSDDAWDDRVNEIVAPTPDVMFSGPSTFESSE